MKDFIGLAAIFASIWHVISGYVFNHWPHAVMSGLLAIYLAWLWLEIEDDLNLREQEAFEGLDRIIEDISKE